MNFTTICDSFFVKMMLVPVIVCEQARAHEDSISVEIATLTDPWSELVKLAEAPLGLKTIPEDAPTKFQFKVLFWIVEPLSWFNTFKK